MGQVQTLLRRVTTPARADRETAEQTMRRCRWTPEQFSAAQVLGLPEPVQVVKDDVALGGVATVTYLRQVEHVDEFVARLRPLASGPALTVAPGGSFVELDPWMAAQGWTVATLEVALGFAFPHVSGAGAGRKVLRHELAHWCEQLNLCLGRHPRPAA